MRILKNLFGKDTKISASEILLSNNRTVEEQEMSIGKIIPNGTDLLTISTPGTYICPAIADVATLRNCPTASAFVLKVMPLTNTSRFYQIFVDYNDSSIVVRTISSGVVTRTRQFLGEII